MIESILPAAVTAVDTFVDPPDATLFRDEEAVIRMAVDKRRREFTTARWCARQAMGRLGRPPAPILPGARGEPQWPEGLVGSITHCAGYRGAVVAERGQVTTVGIDAEPDEPLANGILAAISLPEERDRIAVLQHDHPAVSWDRMLFSAKESVYKAWFPLTGRWLDFEDAKVVLDPLTGTFTAGLLVSAPWVQGRKLTGFSGRWLARNGLIVTAITVLAPAGARIQPAGRRVAARRPR
ncbi:4'-phosphopantetheinyl transferase superfamily protein [Micromonospora sp. NPDC050980]|uniref:4'-phosphopantetheinyl transferase family protein n=1 Tax=Micromonospora sp. NPDC050980 TaxID=3155161 RepID=UPI0033DE3999